MNDKELTKLLKKISSIQEKMQQLLCELSEVKAAVMFIPVRVNAPSAPSSDDDVNDEYSAGMRP